jgi:hypothetical protein
MSLMRMKAILRADAFRRRFLADARRRLALRGKNFLDADGGPVALTPSMSDAPTAVAPQPSRVSRLLSLVRRLIDYGRLFASALQADPRQSDDSDIAAIVARITRGLLRAEALQARIVRNATHLDTGRKPRPVAHSRPSRTGPPETSDPRAGEDRPGQADQPAPVPPGLPTPEQIADLIQRQPIGAVIADICRDLGIRPNHPLWPELCQIIAKHGGSLTRLIIDILHDMRFWRPALSWLIAPAWPAPPRQSPALACTGPPT